MTKDASGRVTVQTASASNLTGILSASVDQELGKKSDSLTFRVHDPYETLFERMNAGDVIKIYSSVDGGTTETLEIDGVVREMSKSFAMNDTDLVVNGLNKLELVLGLITPVAGREGQSRPADYWIRQVIREVNTQNGCASYSGDNGDGEPTSVTIVDSSKYIYSGLKSEWQSVGNDEITNTALYANAGFNTGEEIAFEVIEKLSSQQYAGRLHMMYLDTSNRFRWLPLDVETDGTLSSDNVNTRLTKSQFQDYNYFIIKAGKNLYDNAGIIDFRYDLIQATANGIKAKVLLLEGIRKTVATEMERKMRNEAKWSEDTAPFSTSYPFTLPSSWVNGGASVASDSELNSEFVDEVLVRAGREAETQLLLRSKSGVKNTFVLPPESDQQTAHLLGGYYVDPNSSFIGNTPNLRIVKRQKNYSPKNGWETTIVLEEDADKLG